MNKLIRELLEGRDLPSLSPKEAVVLELLAGGERYGLELVAESDGSLKRGTVYVTLSRMEEKGLVTSRLEARQPGQVGLQRRLYHPTALGADLLKAYKRAVLAFAKVTP